MTPDRQRQWAAPKRKYGRGQRKEAYQDMCDRCADGTYCVMRDAKREAKALEGWVDCDEFRPTRFDEIIARS